MKTIKRIARRAISIFKKKKPEYLTHHKFWVQKCEIKKIASRFQYFESKVMGKSVIHFGCNDYPVFNPAYNLHIFLSKSTKSLHGFDIELEGLETLKSYVDQPYFSSFSQLNGNEYDVCLVPETIEHVDNVADFLKNIASVNAKEYYITAPNCFAQKHMKRNFETDTVFYEVVHPDHNCWFSPFTLKNAIEKYTDLKVLEIILLEDDTMVCCRAVKNEN